MAGTNIRQMAYDIRRFLLCKTGKRMTLQRISDPVIEVP